MKFDDKFNTEVDC